LAAWVIDFIRQNFCSRMKFCQSGG
jgi:hypothetical protein